MLVYVSCDGTRSNFVYCPHSVDVVCRLATVISIAFSLNRNKHFICIMKRVWAFREVGTEPLLLAWVSISWGLDVIVSGLIPDERKTFLISPKCPDQCLEGPPSTGQSVPNVKVISHSQIMQQFIKSGSNFHSTLHLHVKH